MVGEVTVAVPDEGVDDWLWPDRIELSDGSAGPAVLELVGNPTATNKARRNEAKSTATFRLSMGVSSVTLKVTMAVRG
jgi:hypothetical protein